LSSAIARWNGRNQKRFGSAGSDGSSRATPLEVAERAQLLELEIRRIVERHVRRRGRRRGHDQGERDDELRICAERQPRTLGASSVHEIASSPASHSSAHIPSSSFDELQRPSGTRSGTMCRLVRRSDSHACIRG
jgi:hypothetical protein